MEKKSKNVSRRKFIQFLGGMFAGAAGLYTFFPDLRFLSHEVKEAAGRYLPLDKWESMYLRQIITADNRHSRTIMWQSEKPLDKALVEYRIKDEAQIKACFAQNALFTDHDAKSYLYTAALAELTSSTVYEYRVGDGDKRSEWRSLSTAGKTSFKALIFPDSQSNDYSDWAKIAQGAYKANPDADFFVNMGDLVDNGEDSAQWRAWFDSLKGIIDVIPAATVMGNHEAYNLNWKVRMPEAYLRLFSLPPNGRAEFQNQYYSFDYGDAHFIVLDTQLEEMRDFQPDLLAAQQAWFAEDMKKNAKKWNIVWMHKDVLTYEIRSRTDRKAGISDIGKAFMPLFDQYGIDVVLTAHLHTYRRRVRLYDFQPDERGPLYIVTGVAGNVRYPNLWIDHPFDEKVAPQPETNNYLTMEASAEKLCLTSFLPSGEEIDKIELFK